MSEGTLARTPRVDENGQAKSLPSRAFVLKRVSQITTYNCLFAAYIAMSLRTVSGQTQTKTTSAEQIKHARKKKRQACKGCMLVAIHIKRIL